MSEPTLRIGQTEVVDSLGMRPWRCGGPNLAGLIALQKPRRHAASLLEPRPNDHGRDVSRFLTGHKLTSSSNATTIAEGHGAAAVSGSGAVLRRRRRR